MNSDRKPTAPTVTWAAVLILIALGTGISACTPSEEETDLSGMTTAELEHNKLLLEVEQLQAQGDFDST